MRVVTRQRRSARIEIIPLIDVTFLLLVFFIYLSLSMSLNRGIPLELPKSATSKTHESAALVVSLDRGGRVFLEGEPVSDPALKRVVRERMSIHAGGEIELRGHRMIPYERVVEVLDLLREAGARRVILETQTEGLR